MADDQETKNTGDDLTDKENLSVDDDPNRSRNRNRAEPGELFLLRPEVIFLNHGSFGACPRPVFERYQRWQLELERQPVEFLARERRYHERMRIARQSLADYLGSAADELVFVPNATTGLNAVARSLRLEPGDEVLSSDHEYGALDRTWTFVCEKAGASYVRRPVPLPLESPEQIVEAIWSGVTDRTRVLFVSHLTSSTALIFPVARLVELANAAGIVTVVDGAHGPGHIPLNLDALGADYYVGNCHKWLLSPKGAAFLYARPQAQPALEPLVVSFGWRDDDPGPSRFVDEHEYTGTRDIAAYLSVPAALEFRATHRWPVVQERCRELVRLACREVSRLTGLSAICPDDAAWFGQMASIPLPRCEAWPLQTALRERYRIEVPILDWNDNTFVRVSAQAYNDEQDITTLVTALRELLT